MKKIKITKGIQINLIALIVFIVGAIIVGTVSNDDAMASGEGEICEICNSGTLYWKSEKSGHGFKCTNNCGENGWITFGTHSFFAEDGYVYNGNGTHSAHMVCRFCSYEYDLTNAECTPDNWKPSTSVSDGHAKYCTTCKYAVATGNCYDNNSDGNCDVCGDVLRKR